MRLSSASGGAGHARPRFVLTTARTAHRCVQTDAECIGTVPMEDIDEVAPVPPATVKIRVLERSILLRLDAAQEAEHWIVALLARVAVARDVLATGSTARFDWAGKNELEQQRLAALERRMEALFEPPKQLEQEYLIQREIVRIWRDRQAASAKLADSERKPSAVAPVASLRLSPLTSLIAPPIAADAAAEPARLRAKTDGDCLAMTLHPSAAPAEQQPGGRAAGSARPLRRRCHSVGGHERATDYPPLALSRWLPNDERAPAAASGELPMAQRGQRVAAAMAPDTGVFAAAMPSPNDAVQPASAAQAVGRADRAALSEHRSPWPSGRSRTSEEEPSCAVHARVSADGGATTNAFLQRVQSAAQRYPAMACTIFLNAKGREAERLTIGQLYTASTAVAEALVYFAHLSPGDRALLVYPPGTEFVVALLGCFRAGVIAVPVYPPRPGHLNADMPKFKSTLADCGARVALTNAAYSRARFFSSLLHFSRSGEGWPRQLFWLVTTDLRQSCERFIERPYSIALIQYTSGTCAPAARRSHCVRHALGQRHEARCRPGSTSDPKGVMITFGNLMHQFDMCHRDLGFNAKTTAVTWVPQYHGTRG